MRVLLVVHGWPPASQGGTQIYVRELARALAGGGDDVHVLAREVDPERPELSVRTVASGPIRLTLVNNSFASAEGFEATYRNAGVRAVADALAAEIAPDVAHIHHLTGLSTDVVEALADRSVPVVFTLNDYWLLCQRGQLLDVDLDRCAGPFPAGCARCLGLPLGEGPRGAAAASLMRLRARVESGALRPLLGRTAGVLAGPAAPGVAAVMRRLEHVRAMAGRVDRFLAPSRALRDRFVAFGIPPARIDLVAQGIDVARFQGRKRRPSSRIRLGFFGTLMVSKAPHVLLEAYAGLPKGAFTVHLYGAYAPYHGDDRYRRVLEPLLVQEGVRQHGPIPHEQVPDALAATDVLVVPSVWLENAPFVIREALAAGIPVVASDLGGMAEMVDHGKDGLLFHPGDPVALCRALRRFVEEPTLIERLRASLRRVMTIKEDAAQLRRIYAEVRRGRGLSAEDARHAR